jgi:hypothetical protein
MQLPEKAFLLAVKRTKHDTYAFIPDMHHPAAQTTTTGNLDLYRRVRRHRLPGGTDKHAVGGKIARPAMHYQTVTTTDDHLH